jgi:mono/diheme cytochrome c family protein
LFTPTPSDHDLAACDRLAGLSDQAASPEHRVRSYLDANCAQCHRPGGARGLFDARFETPLARQNLVNGPVAAADLGFPGAKLVVPGDAVRSVLYQRMIRRHDVYAMPPLASNEVDGQAVAALIEWINGLPRPPRQPQP